MADPNLRPGSIKRPWSESSRAENTSEGDHSAHCLTTTTGFQTHVFIQNGPFYNNVQTIVNKSVENKKSRLAQPFRIIRKASPYFQGREDYFRQIHELFSNSESSTDYNDKIIALTGYGGMGKSELARKFAEAYADAYPTVGWFDAESTDSMKRSLERFQRKLEIPETANPKVLMEEIYEYTANLDTPALFIFDNVERVRTTADGFGILEYLPLSQGLKKQPFILITSQLTNWDLLLRNRTERVMILKYLSSEEVLAFFRNFFSLSPADMSIMTPLLEKMDRILQGYPLALTLAAAEIKDSADDLESLKSKLNDYIQFLRSSDESFMSQELSESLPDGYERTMGAVWNRTLQRFARQPHVVGVLRILSYMDAINIDPQEVCQVYSTSCGDLDSSEADFVPDQSKVKDAFVQLKRSCLVTTWTGRIVRYEMHRLVQRFAETIDVSRCALVKYLVWGLEENDNCNWDFVQLLPRLRQIVPASPPLTLLFMAMQACTQELNDIVPKSLPAFPVGSEEAGVAEDLMWMCELVVGNQLKRDQVTEWDHVCGKLVDIGSRWLRQGFLPHLVQLSILNMVHWVFDVSEEFFPPQEILKKLVDWLYRLFQKNEGLSMGRTARSKNGLNMYLVNVNNLKNLVEFAEMSGQGISEVISPSHLLQLVNLTLAPCTERSAPWGSGCCIHNVTFVLMILEVTFDGAVLDGIEESTLISPLNETFAHLLGSKSNFDSQLGWGQDLSIFVNNFLEKFHPTNTPVSGPFNENPVEDDFIEKRIMAAPTSLVTTPERTAPEIPSIQNPEESSKRGILPPSPHFRGREDLLQQIHYLLTHCPTESSQPIADRTVVLAGFGGMGKTELARKFLQMYSIEYPNSFWLDASSEWSICSSLVQISSALEMDPNDFSDPTELAEAIYGKLYGIPGATLLVLDNAAGLATTPVGFQLLQYLPKPTWKTPHFLITSRNRDWESILSDPDRVLTVESLSSEESSQVLKSILGDSHVTSNLFSRYLSQYPLALSLSADYCRNHPKASSYDLDCFLVRDLPDAKREPSSKEPAGDSIKEIWEDAKRRLRHCPRAVGTVRILAHLLPRGISVETVRRIYFTPVGPAHSEEADEDFRENKDCEEVYENVFEALRKSCLIAREAGDSSGLWRMPRLIQELARSEDLNSSNSLGLVKVLTFYFCSGDPTYTQTPQALEESLTE